MKNAVFSLMAIVLFTISGKAQESNQTEKATFREAELKTTFNKEDVSYKFNSEKDFEEVFQLVNNACENLLRKIEG